MKKKKGVLNLKLFRNKHIFDIKNLTDKGSSPGISFLLYFTHCRLLNVKQTKCLSYVILDSVHNCVHTQCVNTSPFIHEEELPICYFMKELVLTHCAETSNRVV
jgi:hypothetical protein